MLLSKSFDSICHYRLVLMLLYLLLQPSQLLAITCDKCGFNYDQEDDTFCPSLACYQEDHPHQHDTVPSQSATPVNPVSTPDVQADESLKNQEFAIDQFVHTACNLPHEDFVISPDSLFQTVALILLQAGADGANKQLDQLQREDEYSDPTDGAASSMPSASEARSLAIYKERLKHIADNAPGNVDFTNLGPLESLAQVLNRHFVRSMHGIIQNHCMHDDCHLSAIIEFYSCFYIIAMWKRAFGTQDAALFTLPDGQAAALDRIIGGKINPSQYANHDDWEAFTFPYLENDEIILILPQTRLLPNELRSEVISTLFSSLDAKESFPSSSTMTSELPHSNVDKNTDLSEALSQSGSLAIAVVTNDLSSGAVPVLPAPINVFSEQVARGASLSGAGSKRAHDGETIQSIRFDRPFVYIFRNKITKRIIFIGQSIDHLDSEASSPEPEAD